MDSSFFLTTVAAAIGVFTDLCRKLRFHQEDEEIDSSSSSSSVSPPSSLSVSLVNPPTSSSQNWTHDVFLSFRGEDVRRNVFCHIKKELERKGITPFIDNEIKRGESIGPELIKGIRGSKIAVVLVSKNYASSKWCLDELVEIIKCREELGQTVMTIFYEVDPSHVKKLNGEFGKVFKKTCAGKSKEDIERWRQALVKVATIAGYHSNNWDNEAAMIEKIASDVSSELINSTPSSDFDAFVGMRAHRKNMNLLLQLDSSEVKMIGIWGPSGIGKSTIARVLFSEHSHRFQLSVFMENIKRRYPNSHGYDEYSAKLQLQKEFLSQIINHKDIEIHHLGVAQDRLKDKRVLVVLDDVDQSMQLDAVAKEAWWFGPGSRIIITTQDKKLLNAHGINHIYEVDFPADDEALEIFCMYAFGQKSPYEGFEELALEVTKLAGKLPLGLRVMGSYLKGRTKEEWKRELPRLRTSLDGEIENILEFSYNALGAEDKELFLYIACFFNYQKIEKVEKHLAKDFSDVRQGLRILAEKSLISFIGRGAVVEMHGLLERLGREIVRKQSIHDPGQRQFLVDARDICKVLNNDTLSRGSVIGAIINLSKIEDEFNRSYIALERFSSLQFLRCNDLYNVKNLPRQVRLLNWDHFGMTSLPSNFNPEFLVELNMRGSNLKKLWEGNKTIRNLKWMDLSYSHNLRELPDLSTATNLQELYLTDCTNLVKLPSSIGNAINLQKLNLWGCLSLMELPSSIGNAINLQELDLWGCTRLGELPSSIGNAINLQKLNLSHCSNLVKLPSSIGNAINLQKLNLSHCSNLVKLPSSIGNAINLQKLNLWGCLSLMELSSSIGNAINLQELNLSECSRLGELPSSIGNAINLQKLNLSHCSNLVKLPSSIGNAINLQKLNLWGCLSLMELPSSIGNAINLQELDLSECSRLGELPSSIGNAINLQKLNLSHCSNLVKLPSSIGNAINLQKLNLWGCLSLMELPSSIGNAINLQKLNLRGCTRLGELPSSIGNAINLQKLNLSHCSNLVKLPSSIGNAINLQELDLWGCTRLGELPSSIGNAINLQKLNLSHCSNLVKLPSSIGNAINLQELDLWGCTRLGELPSSIGNAINLQKLNLSHCSNLVKLPSSIGNAINLQELDLWGCTRLGELPSSIGNAINLQKLNLWGCLSLMELPSSIGNAINLQELDLSECSRLGELPSSIGNAINLQKLNLSHCSNLVKLPSSIGNAINLQKLNLRGCSRLGELPSSIENAINLQELNLSGCSRLRELPSSIGNATNLCLLDLSGCSSLVKLPSSIGNLHKLSVLRLKGCSKLEAIPINFNMEYNCELDLTDCLLLKKIPKIFRAPGLTETVKLDRNRSSFKLRISSWEHLGEFSHAFKYITELYLSDKRIQEIAPCVKELSLLREFVIKGCTKLVSLPQLPDSLEILDAQNCESLERLDCSFQNNKLIRLNFANCFKLSQEARDLIIIKTSSYKSAVLPGEKVPPHFTYRATGSSLSMRLSGIDTHFPTSLRFKACVLLVSKGDVEVTNWNTLGVTHRMKEKQNGVDVTCSSANTNLSTRSKKHLFIFPCEEKKLPRLSNSSGELVFEFEVHDENLDIEECGIEECPIGEEIES